MLIFCLFSYNRGQFLENCVASLERSAPDAKLYIFDDDSDDPYTQKVLADIGERHEIVTPPKDSNLSGKFGGLYNNMARAIELMPDNSLACFIQDDMQCVRALRDQDIQDINGFFQAHPDAAFLHPAFLRGGKRARDTKCLRLNAESKSYFRFNEKQSAGINFSAIVIIHIDRLRKADWAFEYREKLNDKKAGSVFGKMGIMANPFCLWLPNVPVYRGKRKTLALKFAERVRKSGFYPVKFMSESEAERFLARDSSVLPFSEDFLEIDGEPLKKPWIYYALEGLSLLKQLNRIELFLAKRFAK